MSGAPFTYEELGTLDSELRIRIQAEIPDAPLQGLRRVVDALRRALQVADHHSELTLARWGRDLGIRLLRRSAWSEHHTETRRLLWELVEGLTDRGALDIEAVRAELVELLGGERLAPVVSLADYQNAPTVDRLADLVSLSAPEISIVLLGRHLRRGVDLNVFSLSEFTGLHEVRCAVGLAKLRKARLIEEAPSERGPLPVLRLIPRLRSPSASSDALFPSDEGAEGGAPPPCAA